MSGLYRLPPDGAPELGLAGPGLVGVAFDPLGGLVVCSNDTAYASAPAGARTRESAMSQLFDRKPIAELIPDTEAGQG